MGSVCPISHEAIVHKAWIVPCNHAFEKDQIEHWYNLEVQAGNVPGCPLDRIPIEEIRSIEAHIENDAPQASSLAEGREISLHRDKGRRFVTLFNAARHVREPEHPEILENPVTKKNLYEGLIAKLDQTGSVHFVNDELFAFRKQVKIYSKLCSSDYRSTRNASRLCVVQSFLKREI